MTQPTLSNGIAQLEDELGGKLFEHTTRSVALTPLGKHLLPSIDRALADVDEVRAHAKAWRDPAHKLIRIGLSPIVDLRLLLAVLAPYRETHPDVEIFFKECFADDLDQRLGNGELDLMLRPSRQERLGQCRLDLYTEPLLYLPSDGGQLAQSDQAVSLAEAATETLVLTMDVCGLQPRTLELFEVGGHPIKMYPGQAANYTAVEDWASVGIGGGILPQSKISAGNPSVRPLLLDSGKPATITVQVFWPSAGGNNEPVEQLIDYLTAEGQQMAANIAA